MRGVVYSDDQVICVQHAFKCWGEPERLEIQVRELVG